MTTHHGFSAKTVPVMEISDELIAQCMHCGLCLPTCPTYAITGKETSSPRGRIRLIKEVVEGRLGLSDTFVDEMEFCLDCQACETACPAGVKYGHLVEWARTHIAENGGRFRVQSAMRRAALAWFFRSHSRLKMAARVLRWYQSSAIRGILDKLRVVNLLAPRLVRIQKLAPRVSQRFSSEILDEVIRPQGAVHGRVGLLIGCIMDVAFADVNVDTVALLLHHGYEVVIPRGQGCCGSLQAHNGQSEVARNLARRNIEVFASDELEYIVMNSAGCGAFMKEYGQIFGGESDLAEKARTISRKTLDITELLAKVGLRIVPISTSRQLAGKRVTYHDACHLAHTQRIVSQPRKLIRSIPGIDFLELPESSWCCGSAGIYNILRFNDSMKFLDRKVANIASVRPDIIVTGNPGCAAQLQFGLEEAGISANVMQTPTFLRIACGA